MEGLERRLLFHGLAGDDSTGAESDPTGTDAVSTRSIRATGWTKGANAPQALFEATGAEANGKLYVFSGFITDAPILITQHAEVYDPATNRWAKLADAPIPESHVGTAGDGHVIYFAGGFRGDWKGQNTPISDEFWMFNADTAQWSQGPNLPEARAAGALALDGRTLHFYGGFTADGFNDSADHWALDLDNPTAGWVRKASLPVTRNHLGYAALNGKIYAIGGQHGQDEADGTDANVDVYDPATNKWSPVAPLPNNKSHLHNSTFVYNGKIYCVGGTNPGAIADAQILSYDPAVDQWSVVGLLPAARSAAVAKVVGDQLVVTTGTPTGVHPEATTWRRRITSLATGSNPLGADLTADVDAPSPAEVIAGDKASAIVRVHNIGQDRFKDNVDISLLLSTDVTVDDADFPLTDRNVRLKLNGGSDKNVRLKFNYPAQAAGPYYVLALVTPADMSSEVSAANNVGVSAATVNVVPQIIDLAGTLTEPSREVAPGQKLSSTVTITNAGNTKLDASLTYTISAVPAGGGAEMPLATVTRPLRISPEKAKRVKVKVLLPAEVAAGQYVLMVHLNTDNAVADPNPSNNVASSPAPFTVVL